MKYHHNTCQTKNRMHLQQSIHITATDKKLDRQNNLNYKKTYDRFVGELSRENILNDAMQIWKTSKTSDYTHIQR